MKPHLLLLLSLLLAGCKEDKIDPRQAILGKWENFALGNGGKYGPPYKDPGGYWDFGKDSLLLDYGYASKHTFFKKYWIDTMLHVGILRGDGIMLKNDYSYKIRGDTMEMHTEHVNAIYDDS